MEKNNLPLKWIKTELKNCVDIFDSSRVPINATEREKRKGTIPYYGATGQVGWIDDFLFNEELVLLGEDGAPFFDSFKDKAYMIHGKSWVNNHVHVLKGKNKILSSKFLCHYLNQFNYHDFVTGTTRLKLNQTSMKKIPLIVPPYNEQKRIVSKIDNLFDELRVCMKNIENITLQIYYYKQSFLKSAFTGVLTKSWREENEIENKFETNDLNQLVLFSKNGLTGRPNQNKTGTLRLGIETITQSDSIFTDNSKCKFQKIDPKKMNTYLAKTNDLFVCRQNGNKNYVGKCAIFKENKTPTIFSDSLIQFRIDQTQILPLYLAYFLNSMLGRIQIEKYCSTTAGNYSINGTNYKKVMITYPSIPEQKIIIQKIQKILSFTENIEKQVKILFNNSHLLRISILKKAFEGNLVSQDPKDQSVSICLEK